MTLRKKTKDPFESEFRDEMIKIGMSERSIADVTFTYADHQYLNRLLNVRDIAVQKEVIDYVIEKVAEHNAPLYSKLEQIEKLLRGFDDRLKLIEFKTSWWMAFIFAVMITALSVSASLFLFMELHSKLPQ